MGARERREEEKKRNKQKREGVRVLVMTMVVVVVVVVVVVSPGLRFSCLASSRAYFCVRASYSTLVLTVCARAR